MSDRPRILFIDSNASDIELASLLLQQSYPALEIISAVDAPSLFDALRGSAPEVVITTPAPLWTSLDKLLELIRGAWQRSAVVLFGNEQEILHHALAPASTLDGMAAKSSAGFMALPTIVDDILRQRAKCPPPDLDAWPLPAAHVDAAASIRTANTTDDATAHEFGDMALVFSHDLKEPVQQVVRLVQRLEDSREEEPRNADKLLRQLHDCATRAANMLDSMVAYLTVSASQAQHAPVDLDLCLEEALDNLRPAIEETTARITAEPLPKVHGSAVQMVHLFQNLLANAIKFHGPATPEVQITAECVDERLRISFHDNGIGISAAQREHVFEMGKRLHTQEEFPGTGMGLTLCRRITERHGGSIRIEAGSQGGSVVVVELPLPPPATSYDSLDRARKPPP